MTVLSGRREDLLEHLVRLAGDPFLVERALRELNAELPDPPTVEQVVERILTLRRAASSPSAVP